MRVFDQLVENPFAKDEDGEQYYPFQYYGPPCQITKEFRRELRNIGGRTPDGRPILRIGWGMDIKWWYQGKMVPRYVASRKTTEVEEYSTDGKVIAVRQITRYFGRPTFIVEEWKPATFFKPPGIRDEDAEKFWEENHRYKICDEEDEPPPESGFKGKWAKEEWQEWKQANQQRRFILTGTGRRDPETGAGEVIQDRIDLWGAFPRNGRYEYLCQLKPGTHPNEDFLRTIKEAIYLRTHRRYATVEAELAAWQEDLEAERAKARLKQTLRLQEELMLHWHPFDVSPNKGGSGQSIVFQPGIPVEHSKENQI